MCVRMNVCAYEYEYVRMNVNVGVGVGVGVGTFALSHGFAEFSTYDVLNHSRAY